MKNEDPYRYLVQMQSPITGGWATNWSFDCYTEAAHFALAKAKETGKVVRVMKPEVVHNYVK